MRRSLLYLNIILLFLGLASCNTVDPAFVVFSLNNLVLVISNIIFIGISSIHIQATKNRLF